MRRGLWLGLTAFLACGVACSGNGRGSGGPPRDSGSGDEAQPDGGGQTLDAAAPEGGATGDGGDASVGARGVGDACGLDAQCPAGGSGTTACLTKGYPDGYCSVVECEQHGHDCPDDAGLAGDEGTVECVQMEVLQCMKLCTSADDCRDGYDCAAVPDSAGHGTVDVCVPAAAVMQESDGGMGDDAGMMGDGGMMGGGGMGD